MQCQEFAGVAGVQHDVLCIALKAFILDQERQDGSCQLLQQAVLPPRRVRGPRAGVHAELLRAVGSDPRETPSVQGDRTAQVPNDHGYHGDDARSG